MKKWVNRFLMLCITSVLIAGTLGAEYGIASSDFGDLGKYTWEGQWDSNWGDMVLTQSGNVAR